MTSLDKSYRGVADTVSAHGAVAISKSDSTVFPVTRGVYVGTAGNVAVRMADGQTVTFVAPATGVEHPWQIDKLLETGTDASDVVALY